ncbi:type II toxin-antitoxin system RnlB family antitoxin [Clostridium amazonitimonense]|uniref:type II toxin-antitoxin system RnlB family antitoxin n=1 Tax=Clostridium amazonitimonense TaxID=1499689 RepID=UPI00068D2430|nr:type II toxin-antitoxin system RnlB family antitoxin [Clostridium amazonitimonense]
MKTNNNYIIINTNLVFSTSYISPLDDIIALEKDLKQHNVLGEVIFDLLLSVGNATNRYIKGYFDGTSLDISSIKVINDIDEVIKEASRNFYMNHKELLDRGILNNATKYMVVNGLI